MYLLFDWTLRFRELLCITIGTYRRKILVVYPTKQLVFFTPQQINFNGSDIILYRCNKRYYPTDKWPCHHHDLCSFDIDHYNLEINLNHS